MAGLSYADRNAAGLTHVRTGPFRLWEDLLVSYLGHGWRALASSQSERSWMKSCNAVITKICQDFNLPLPWQAQLSKDQTCKDIAKTSDLKRSWPLECMPPVTLKPASDAFVQQAKQRQIAAFSLYMDSNILVDGMNGTGKVDKKELRPLLVRSARVWHKILKTVTSYVNAPPGLAIFEGSPLTWTPREHNRQADYLCHLTLERKQSWHDVLVEPSEFDFQEGDYLAGWSDGGYDGLAGGTALTTDGCQSALTKAGFNAQVDPPLFPLAWVSS